jgi:hypothetical protein
MFAKKSMMAFATARRTMFALTKSPAVFSMIASSQRAFNTKFNSIESGSGKLIRALEKEVKYEQDNYT